MLIFADKLRVGTLQNVGELCRVFLTNFFTTYLEPLPFQPRVVVTVYADICDRRKSLSLSPSHVCLFVSLSLNSDLRSLLVGFF